MTSIPHRSVQFLRIAGSSDTLTSMQARGIRTLVGTCLLAGLLGAPSHAAQITTEYGLGFVTVGDPGNRPTDAALDSGPLADTPDDFWREPGLQVGSVGYAYRIARNELSVGQWFEFVETYLPYVPANHVTDSSFTSTAIDTFLGVPTLRAGHSMGEPVEVSFEYAARYANWLHNGKVNEAWAFESGAYDTTTFTENPDGSTNHQLTHSPEARFWIPTEDEYVKAAYWDPLKDGTGGYWLYPHGSNTAPLPGRPGEGGQTSAGVELDPGEAPLPVGSYPHVQSPWGLLDASGGAREAMETRPGMGWNRWQRVRGSRAGESTFLDRLDVRSFGFVDGIAGGVRIATNVPAPNVIVLPSLWIAFQTRRVRCKLKGDRSAR